MTWQSAGVWGGEGGSGSALVGGFGSWTCIYCSVAPSHRNKPFLIDGTLSPAASPRRNQISGTSVSSETKKKKSSACSSLSPAWHPARSTLPASICHSLTAVTAHKELSPDPVGSSREPLLCLLFGVLRARIP